MEGKYTLKSGKRIQIFLWEDFLEGDDWRARAGRPCVDVRKLNEDGTVSAQTIHKFLKKDDKGLYINWRENKGSPEYEKVYLANFDYMPYAELVKAVQKAVETKDRWAVWDDDILSTFMKEPEMVRVVADLPVPDMVIPGMGIALCGDKEKTCRCKLSDHHYGITRWHYKVTLVPEDDNGAISRDFYFSDFCSLLKSGILQLV